MSQKQTQRLEYTFRVNTLEMVEETLKNMNESLITVAGLKKILPRQVNHNTLMEILGYLERKNRVTTSLKGITYLGENSPRIQKILEKSHPH